MEPMRVYAGIAALRVPPPTAFLDLNAGLIHVGVSSLSTGVE